MRYNLFGFLTLKSKYPGILNISVGIPIAHQLIDIEVQCLSLSIMHIKTIVQKILLNASRIRTHISNTSTATVQTT